MEKANKLNAAYAGEGTTFVLNLTEAKVERILGRRWNP